MRWDIVTLSLGCGIDADEIHKDVLHLQNIEFPNCEEVLVVNDASEDVGSGGAALNALIRTAERLCFRQKFTVLNESVLQDANILIVLVNDKRALLNSTSISEGGVGYLFETHLTRTIENATQVADRADRKGVWIIGSDWFFSIDIHPDVYILPQNGITGFTFGADKEENGEHGWYRTKRNGSERIVSGMEFGDVLVDSEGEDEGLIILGFVYMPLSVSVAFLSLHSKFPVAATTYLGIDSNVKPLKLSLFFDFMMATCTNRNDFICNKLGIHRKVSDDLEDRSHARTEIFDSFSVFKGYVLKLNVSNFSYKNFPIPTRNYKDFLEALPRDLLKSESVERTIRTELSIQKLDYTKKELELSHPSTILSVLRNTISGNHNAEVHLQVIFTASLALSIASNGKGGLRNGPAKNPRFSQIKETDMGEYLKAVFNEILSNWIHEPNKMIRAARHLETAAQRCIRQFVDEMCIPRAIELRKTGGSPREVRVSAPARIDFFGGWLDTPPIFFSMEYAAVVNMAIQLDNENPITCLLTKIDDPILEILQDDIKIQIKNEEELQYLHDKPTETGSLVCACILALNFTTLSDFFNVLSTTGLRIETHSNLPHGSGLGTSSILASTILKAFTVMGCAVGNRSEELIVHTVLRVEQIMTTGGGWQDQIGALYPGLKRCYFSKSESKIAVEPIQASPEFIRLLEQRLLLVYTGKTRLAKNLLQEVIRNYFTCSETKKKLLSMAQSIDRFSENMERGVLPVDLIREYHSTKKFMTRCEPPIVTELLETLERKKMIEVGWAAGAGGGGFVYLYLSANSSRDEVEKFLSKTSQFSTMTCHSVSIPTSCPFKVDIPDCE